MEMKMKMDQLSGNDQIRESCCFHFGAARSAQQRRTRVSAFRNITYFRTTVHLRVFYLFSDRKAKFTQLLNNLSEVKNQKPTTLKI